MKYTAKQRAQAIEICDVAASNPILGGSYGSACVSLGIPRMGFLESGTPNYLALAAWKACVVHVGAERDAAAAQLLRDGWSPGEPTVRIDPPSPSPDTSTAIIRAHVEEAGLTIEDVQPYLTTYGNGDVSRTVTIRVPRAMLEAQAECEREAKEGAL